MDPASSSGVLTLPVSIGEALDKFSILEIKSRYITQKQRREYIRQESEALEPLVHPYIERCSRLYELLVQCNERIWVLMEQMRNGEIGPEDYRILSENDARFRIKRKINTACVSLYHEQKSFYGEPFVLKYTPPLTTVAMLLIEEISVYYDGLHLYGNLLKDTVMPPTADPEIMCHCHCDENTPVPSWSVVISTLDDLIQCVHKHRQAIQTDA
jgi:hypothetical protein